MTTKLGSLDFLVNLKLIHFSYLNNTDTAPVISGSYLNCKLFKAELFSRYECVQQLTQRGLWLLVYKCSVIRQNIPILSFLPFPQLKPENLLTPLCCLRTESSLTALKQWKRILFPFICTFPSLVLTTEKKDTWIHKIQLQGIYGNHLVHLLWSKQGQAPSQIRLLWVSPSQILLYHENS